MSPFWTSLFGNLKDCGRNATLFICVLAALLGVPLLIVIIGGSNLPDYILRALPWVGLAVVAWGVVAICRACARRRERWEQRPLSCDELRVARSKLVKDRNTKSNPKIL